MYIYSTYLRNLCTFAGTSFTHQDERLILFQEIYYVILIPCYWQSLTLQSQGQRLIRIVNKLGGRMCLDVRFVFLPRVIP